MKYIFKRESTVTPSIWLPLLIILSQMLAARGQSSDFLDLIDPLVGTAGPGKSSHRHSADPFLDDTVWDLKLTGHNRPCLSWCIFAIWLVESIAPVIPIYQRLTGR